MRSISAAHHHAQDKNAATTKIKQLVQRIKLESSYLVNQHADARTVTIETLRIFASRLKNAGKISVTRIKNVIDNRILNTFHLMYFLN